MSWRAFLSYSRQQYYFAESLALALQNKGIALWFDVQQLEPGSDWKADIEDGLTRSEMVLLLASRASLASPYVEREWRHALERRRIVIVGIIETVRIPRDLRQMPILDLRGDFDRAVDRLITQLEQPTPTRPVAAWLAKLAPGVRRMARSLLVWDVRQVLGALLLSLLALAFILYSSVPRLVLDAAPGWINRAFSQLGSRVRFTLDLSAIAPWILALVFVLLLLNLLRVVTRLQTLRFVARRFDYSAIAALHYPGVGMLAFLWALLAAGHLDILRRFFDPRGIPPIDPGLLAFMGIGIILMRVLRWVSRRLAPAHPNPDIVRFAALGKVSTAWRTQVNGADPTKHHAPQRAAQDRLTMHLYAEPGDEDVVRMLRPLVEQMGGRFVTNEEPAHYDLLILSHTSRLERIREALGGDEGVLGILASRCTIPAELQQLRSLQLVDFSRRDASSLIAALGLLTASSDADRMRMQAHRDPVSLQRVADPPIVARLAEGLLALAVLCVVMIGLLALSGITGDALLLNALALGGCAVVLFAATLAAQRGRALLPRPLLIAILFAPLSALAMSGFTLPAGATLFGTTLPLNPQGVFTLMGAAGLVTCGAVVMMMRNPHALSPAGHHAFGMPRLKINLPAVLGWVFATLAIAGFVVSGS